MRQSPCPEGAKLCTKFGAVLLAGLLSTALSTTAAQTRTEPVNASPQVVERGPHHRVWERIELEPSPSGETREKVHRYTELATGMHFQKDGQWRETRAEIVILPSGGALADQGPHKARFAPNLNSAGAIQLDTPDGKTLRSHVLGLSYFDTSTGKSVLIAEVQDTIGQLLPSKNQILYEDTFDGVKADVRYTYTKAGFEQDIIFREQPPSPEEWGMNPKTTRLQVLTEFITPPQPGKESVLGKDGANDDRSLSFGEMSVGLGRAFSESDGGSKSRGVPVGKNWQKLEGRDFLIEEVPFNSAARELKNLPKPQASITTTERIKRMASIDRRLPSAPALSSGDKPMLLAVQEPPQNGYVVDYQLLGGSTNDFIFKGDTTYHVTGAFVINGAATIEGGTVVKFGVSSANVTFNGAVKCETGPYRPAVFTAQDDDTVGEILGVSTGTPSGTYGEGLNVLSAGNKFDHLRMLYSARGIWIYTGTGGVTDIVNSQFISCYEGVHVSASTNRILNSLFAKTELPLVIEDGLAIGQNLTVDQCYQPITPPDGGGSTVNFTNCIFSAVIYWNTDVDYVTNNCAEISSGSGVFASVGGGGYYLSGSGYRNVGTTNIDTTLLASLKNLTTYAPVVYSNTTISATTNLGPQVARDTDVPDLGYHYDPLDYVFTETYVTTNLTFQPGAAAGWFFRSGSSHGIRIADQKILTFDGRLNSECRWVRCNAVQEGSTGLWAGGNGAGGIIGTADQETRNVALSPEVRARFTKFSSLAYGGNFFRDYWGYIIVRARDCEFASGSAGGYINSLYLTNCLFDRVNLGNVYGWIGTAVSLQNCTFRGGVVDLERSTWDGGEAIPLTIRDCAFDGTSFTLAHNYSDANVSYSYNAFINGAARLTPTNSNDKLVATFNWQTGPLGNFYLPNNSTNLNAGSTYATNVGLYHFTMTTNQVKETNSIVDIGYHYVATTNAGSTMPFDTDGDGIPDYLEDANGNGVADTSETSWVIYNSLNGLTTGNPIQVYSPINK